MLPFLFIPPGLLIIWGAIRLYKYYKKKNRKRQVTDFNLLTDTIVSLNEEDSLSTGSIECSICIEELKDIDRLVKLKCGHMFHQHCLTLWYLVEPYCPICRRFVVLSNFN